MNLATLAIMFGLSFILLYWLMWLAILHHDNKKALHHYEVHVRGRKRR